METETTWTPKPGWLMLIPVVLPDKTEGGLILPDTATIKTNSGIVVKIGQYDTPQQHELLALVGNEVFFSQHDEYRIIDSDTQQLFYVLHESKIILWRTPPPTPKFFAVSKGEDGVRIPHSLTRSLGGESE